MASTDSVVISFNGSEIASTSSSGTTILTTSGKYCPDDITVVYTKPTGGDSPISSATIQSILNGTYTPT